MGQTEIEQGFQGLVFLIVIIVLLVAIYPLFLFRIRTVLLRKIKSFMQQNVDINNVELVYNQKLKKRPATNKLEFIKLNSDSHLIEASLTRRKTVSSVKKRYNKRLLLDFIFLIIYFLIVYVITIEISEYYNFIIEEINYDKTLIVDYLGVLNLEWVIFYGNVFLFINVILAVWIILRVIGAYYQFNKYNNRFLDVVKPLWNLISYLFISKWAFPLYFIMFLTGFAVLLGNIIFFNSYKSSIEFRFFFMFLLVLTFLVHFLIHYKAIIKSRDQSNLKLLILRVFGQYVLSQNLFTRLGRIWTMFGTYFTVIDKSYYQVFWKKKYNSNIGVYIFISVFLFIGIGQFGMNFQNEIGQLLSIIIAFFALLSLIMPLVVIHYYNNLKIKRDVISSEKKLNEQLNKLQKWPTRLDNSFKEVPVLCYNDTWRMAVDKLSKFSDIILMDLRGYSETNKGCEYEVNFLFDHVPIDKIIFITDSESIVIIEQLLIEQWKMLLETSPNLKRNEPKSVIYVTADNKDTNKETQGIFDTLLYYAIKNDE